MATLAESFMADLADLSDDSAGSEDDRQQAGDVVDGEDLLVCQSNHSATWCAYNVPDSLLRDAAPSMACHMHSCWLQRPLMAAFNRGRALCRNERNIKWQMRDAGRDGAAGGPKTGGSLTSTAKLTSSSRYADIIGKVQSNLSTSSHCQPRSAVILQILGATPAWASCMRRDLHTSSTPSKADGLTRLGRHVLQVRAALAEGDEAEQPAAWTGPSEQDPAYQWVLCHCAGLTDEHALGSYVMSQAGIVQ
jgi:hypothetical protein